jgi:hypothetical protein
MFVKVVEFPPVAEGRDAGTRRLLEDTKAPGRYAAIVEHESEATFMAMHLSAHATALDDLDVADDLGRLLNDPS